MTRRKPGEFNHGQAPGGKVAEPRLTNQGYTALWPWIVVLLRRKTALLLGTGLMTLTVFAALGLLALSGWFITAAGVTALLLAAGVAAYLDVYVPGAGIRALALTRTLARYLERLYNHHVVLSLLADLRVQLFRHLSRSAATTTGVTSNALWLQRLTQDIDTLDALYLRLLAPPLVAILASLLYLFLVGLWLPAALVGSGALLLAQALVSSLLPAVLGYRWGRRLARAQEHLRHASLDHWQGLAELTAAGQCAHHRQRLVNAERDLQQAQERLNRVSGLSQSLQQTLLGLVIVWILGSGAGAVATGELSGPLWALLILAALALNEAWMPLPKAFSEWGRILSVAERLNAITTPMPHPSTGVVSQSRMPDPPVLRLQELTLAPLGEPLFAPLTFTLQPGEWLIITGASGQGKSSLADVILGRRVPEQGQLWVHGHPPAPWPPPQGLSDCAWLSQHTEILAATVADNLRLAQPTASDAELWQVLRQVELATRIAQHPTGLQTWIGSGGVALSGGEQRRLALARLLLLTPKLIILDEPLRGVDTACAQRILHEIEVWARDRSLVWLAHEQSVLPSQGQRLRLEPPIS